MTILVDHNRRRVEILERAFELFAEKGFAGVTYQKIADRCGVSRTSIYKYYKDKDEIFNSAIKLSTDKLSALAKKIRAREGWSSVDKIRRVLRVTIRLLQNNAIFLTVVLSYLTALRASGGDVGGKARRHTRGMRLLLQRLVREAIRENRFRPGNARQIADRLYCAIEAFVLNLTVTKAMTAKECWELVGSYVDDCLTPEERAREAAVRANE